MCGFRSHLALIRKYPPAACTCSQIGEVLIASVREQKLAAQFPWSRQEIPLALLVGGDRDMADLVAPQAHQYVKFHGGGADLREAAAEDFLQVVVDGEGGAVLNEYIVEEIQLVAQLHAQYVAGQLGHDGGEDLSEEGRELPLRQPVVKRLVSGLQARQKVEASQDVRDRMHRRTAQRLHQRADQALGSDVPEPFAVAALTGQRGEVFPAQRGSERVAESGNMGPVQRWPPSHRVVSEIDNGMVVHRWTSQ